MLSLELVPPNPIREISKLLMAMEKETQPALIQTKIPPLQKDFMRIINSVPPDKALRFLESRANITLSDLFDDAVKADQHPMHFMLHMLHVPLAEICGAHDSYMAEVSYLQTVDYTRRIVLRNVEALATLLHIKIDPSEEDKVERVNIFNRDCQHVLNWLAGHALPRLDALLKESAARTGMSPEEWIQQSDMFFDQLQKEKHAGIPVLFDIVDQRAWDAAIGL